MVENEIVGKKENPSLLISQKIDIIPGCVDEVNAEGRDGENKDKGHLKHMNICCNKCCMGGFKYQYQCVGNFFFLSQ